MPRKFLRPILLALVAWPPLAWGAAELLVVTAELHRADAIVVLSGAQAYAERAERAAQLFHEGRAPIILLTNDGLRGPWSPSRQDNPRFVDQAADELSRLGVEADRIEIVPEIVSGGTYGEAIRIRQYASTHRLESILIVTSAYHSRRALWTMRHVLGRSGIEVGIAAAKHEMPVSMFWWLLPSGYRMVAVEYVKFVYYLVRYS